MKYFIELSVRGRGLQLFPLTEDDKNELMNENLDEIYLDWVDKRDYAFEMDNQYLMRSCDRFYLSIKDENCNIVYEIDNPNNLVDKTCDENGKYIKGWHFDGVDDGIYLTRIQTIKGCYYTGEFELNEPFDKDKLYIVRDTQINDELLGDDVFPIDTIYYQQGESINLDNDRIDLDFDSDMGEQYFHTHILKVEERDYWTEI